MQARPPLPPALARDMDLALEAMKAQAWSDCAAKVEPVAVGRLSQTSLT